MPDRGPQPDDSVWVATLRRGITAHRTANDGEFSAHHRELWGDTGWVLLASKARDQYDAAWCDRCWPTTEETTP